MFFINFVFIIIMEILPFVIVASIIISIVVKSHKMHKTLNNNLPDFKNTISNANNPEEVVNENQDFSTYCDYCGSKMERARKRCPACGARIQKSDDLK